MRNHSVPEYQIRKLHAVADEPFKKELEKMFPITIFETFPTIRRLERGIGVLSSKTHRGFFVTGVDVSDSTSIWIGTVVSFLDIKGQVVALWDEDNGDLYMELKEYPKRPFSIRIAMKNGLVIFNPY